MQIFYKEAKMNLLLLFAVLSSGLMLIDARDLVFKQHSGNKQHISNDLLPRNVNPLLYYITLMPDISVYNGDVIIHGKSSILIDITHTTSVIRLHFMGIVMEATMTGEDGTVFEPDRFYFEKDTLLISFKDLIMQGYYNLTIKYISFPPSERGIFQTSRFANEEDEGKWYITTTFQPIGARYAFPCWDEPAAKAIFRISVRHHRNYTVFASTALKKEITENHMIWKHFAQTPYISVYRLGIMIAPLDDLSCSSVADKHGSMCYKRHLSAQMQFAHRIIRLVNEGMAEYMRAFIRVPRVEHVVIAGMQQESIENRRLVVYREDAIIYDKELDSTAEKMKIARLIICTIAHQWFGNLVSPSWWTQLWLSEGFAHFIQTNIYTKINPQWRLNELFAVQTQHESLHLDIDYNVISLDGKNVPKTISLSPFSLRIKAPAILRMLEYIITKEVFQEGTIKYLTKYKYKDAKAKDLWNAMNAVLNKSNVNHSYYKLERVMDTWIKQQNYPVIHVKRNYDTGEVIIWQGYLGEKQDDSSKKMEKWWIPVTFTTQANLDFSDTVPQMWLKPKNLHEKLCIYRLKLQCTMNNSDWLILNLQRAGYYRVKYDRENWRLIADYLNSKEYRKIHVLNRAQIIDDAYHFMMKKQLDCDMFIKLTNYLSREIDYIAWYPMFKNFEYLSSFLPFEESYSLKTHMLKILNGLLIKIGYEDSQTDDDLTRSLRQEAAKWTCILGEPQCKKVANIKLKEHLEASKKHKILAGWKEWTYCHGLTLADLATWYKMRDHLINMKISRGRAFEFFPCIERSATVDIILKSISSENDIKHNQRINLFYSAIVKYAKNNLDIILENLEEYSMMKHNKTKALSIIINHVYSTKHLQKIERYVYENIQEEQIISDIIDALRARWNRIAYHIAKISKLFHVKSAELPKLYRAETFNGELFNSKLFVQLSRNVRPLHYDIKAKVLELGEGKFITENEQRIKFMIRHETRDVMLHAPKNSTSLNIRKALLFSHDSNDQISDTGITMKSNALEKSYYILSQSSLTFHFEDALSPANYTLILKYNNVIHDSDKIMYRTSYINNNGIKVWVSATRFRPIGAREMFPCWDEPAFKSTFNISIKYKRLYMALSNALGWTQHPYKDKNFIMSHFQNTLPISTYSLAVVIMPNFDHAYYDEKYERDYIWCRPHLIQYVKYISKLAEAMGRYFASVTSVEIPKMDHFVMRDIPDEITGGIGLIIYNEANIIFDEKLNCINHKIEMAHIMAHSMARQWFGDVISPSLWSYLWLTDGLAVYFADQAINEILPSWRMDKLFVVQIQHESLHSDVDYNMRAIAAVKEPSKIKMLNSYSLYIKAPAIIRMLRYISTNHMQAFQGIIRTYFKEHQFQAVTPEDLWVIIEKENLNNSINCIDNTFHTDCDRPVLKDVMDAWITQMHYPVLKVTRDYDNGMVIISQESFSTLDSNRWWIPVTYTTQTKLNFADTLPKLWLKPDAQNLMLRETVRKDEWIMLNLKQAGYYRVDYDLANWRLIASYLNSGNHSKIHVLNRAQIIDDAYHLMMANRLDYDVFLNLTSYLSVETDYIAWYPMLKIIEYLSPFLPYKESAPLKDHMLTILNGLLKNIGYKEHQHENDLTKCLRQFAAKWACFLGDSYCKIEANSKLKDYLKNPVQEVLPGWKEWTFCNGLKMANRITWLKFWSVYGESFDNKTLDFISCSGGLVIPNFRVNLKHMRTNFVPWTNELEECTNFLHSVITRNPELKLANTLNDFEEYIFYCSIGLRDVVKLLAIIINRVYVEHELLKVEKYVQDNLQQEKIATDIHYMIKTRWYQIKHQMNKLSQLLTKRS